MMTPSCSKCFALNFFLFTRKTNVDVFKFLRVEERIIADVRPNRRNKTELFSKFSDVLWTRLITHLNNMVKGIPKFPRMAWRYGGVLDPLHAKTIIAPFNALQKPIKNSRDWGKRFSVSPISWGEKIRINRVPNPNITTNDRLAKDNTK